MNELADSDLQALKKVVHLLDDNPSLVNSSKLGFFKSFLHGYVRRDAELAVTQKETPLAEEPSLKPKLGSSKSAPSLDRSEDRYAAFTKAPEDRCPQHVHREVLMGEAYKAVGAIYKGKRILGTGFLINGLKIMTCLHIFLTKSVWEGKQPPTEVQEVRVKLMEMLQLETDFRINFTLYDDIPVSLDSFRIIEVCYLSKDLDLLILGLDRTDIGADFYSLPLPFLNFGELAEDTTENYTEHFSFVGHPGGRGKQRDSDCILRMNFDRTLAVKDVKTILRQEHAAQSRLEELDQYNDSQYYPTVGDKNFYMFDTCFQFGASGSPGLRVNFDGKVDVVTMLAGGAPALLLKPSLRFLLDVDRRNYYRDTRHQLFLEHGVKMKAVYQHILKDDPALGNQIFVPGYFPKKWKESLNRLNTHASEDQIRRDSVNLLKEGTTIVRQEVGASSTENESSPYVNECVPTGSSSKQGQKVPSDRQITSYDHKTSSLSNNNSPSFQNLLDLLVGKSSARIGARLENKTDTNTYQHIDVPNQVMLRE